MTGRPATAHGHRHRAGQSQEVGILSRNLTSPGQCKGVSDAEAAKLSTQGKAVVWIDGGLHATESLCAQVLIETVYQLLHANDPETLAHPRRRHHPFVHANPTAWTWWQITTCRDKNPKNRALTGLPRLYQKYIGHDNNRDFYANTQAETKNMNRVK